MLQDDWFGVDEPLNETGADGRGLVVTGKHWLLLSSPEEGPRFYRTYAQEMFYQPLLLFTPYSDSYETYREKFKTTFSGLTRPLPENVNFLTVSQWNAGRMLLRLEHLYQKTEDHYFSTPVSVDLKNLLSTYDVMEITETTLSASRYLAGGVKNNLIISLNPMEIRTFVVSIKTKSVN